jgi:hypothetical protein
MSDDGAGDMLDVFTTGDTQPGNPDDVPYVDDLFGLGETMAEIERDTNPIGAMSNVVATEAQEASAMAGGRTIGDAAVDGENMILTGDPEETWDKIKPGPIPGVAESATDEAGRVALESIQLGADVVSADVPGGSFTSAFDAIDHILPPKPEPQFSGLPADKAAEGDAHGDQDDGPHIPLYAVQADDAVDAVMGDDVAAPAPAPEPEWPVIATNPDDAVAEVEAPAPSFDITTPDAADMGGVYETVASDDGGGWDAGGGTDLSYDEGF